MPKLIKSSPGWGHPLTTRTAWMDVWTDIGQEARDIGFERYLSKEKFEQYLLISNRANPADPVTIQFHALFDKARPLFVSCLDAMAAWYKRPWFKRVWVVQEFCLGADTVFVCGHKTVAVELVLFATQIYHSCIGDVLSTNFQIEHSWRRSPLFKLRSQGRSSA